MHSSFSLAKRKLDDAKREFQFANEVEAAVIPKMHDMETIASAQAASALRATVIEGVYTGAEGVLKEILSVVDGGVAPTNDGWHARLLAQAAEENPDGRRSAIISQQTYVALDRLRAFRHIERGVYRHFLQRSGVEENLALLQDVFPKFAREIEQFMEEFRFPEK